MSDSRYTSGFLNDLTLMPTALLGPASRHKTPSKVEGLSFLRRSEIFPFSLSFSLSLSSLPPRDINVLSATVCFGL